MDSSSCIPPYLLASVKEVCLLHVDTCEIMRKLPSLLLPRRIPSLGYHLEPLCLDWRDQKGEKKKPKTLGLQKVANFKNFPSGAAG